MAIYGICAYCSYNGLEFLFAANNLELTACCNLQRSGAAVFPNHRLLSAVQVIGANVVKNKQYLYIAH